MARARSNSRGRWVGRLALIAFGCAVGAVVAAFGLAALEWNALRQDVSHFERVATEWHDPNTRFDSELGWRPIPSRRVRLPWGEIRTNEQGFRSDPLRRDAEAIAVLGDSVAWGWGVAANQTFAGRLDRAVRELGWQVSNLAVSGYGLGQSYLWLVTQRQSLPALRHAVLAICADNDIDDTAANSRYGRRKPVYRMRDGQLRLEGTPIARYSLRHWYTDSGAMRGLLARAPRLEAATLARLGDLRVEPEEANEVIGALLAAMRDEVRGRGGTLHAVLLPSRRDWDALSTNYQRLRRAVREAGIPLVEPRTLLQLVASSPDEVFFDASHLTPAAHTIVSLTLQWHLTRYEKRGPASSQRPATSSSGFSNRGHVPRQT